MKPFAKNIPGPLAGLVLLGVVLASGGCDSYTPTWTTRVDSVALYSLTRPEYIDRPGAYDLANQQLGGGGAVVVELPRSGSPVAFDFAITEIDGQLNAMPAGMFEGFDVDPGIHVDSTGVTFDEWSRAPGDDYVTDRAIPLRAGMLFALRSRPDSYQGCTHYGKFEVVSLDPAGIVELRAVGNPLCNDHSLIPKD